MEALQSHPSHRIGGVREGGSMVEDTQHQGEGKVPLSSDFESLGTLYLSNPQVFFSVKWGSLEVSTLLQKWLV